MRKIIAIGESIYDTYFKDDKPERSFVGGRIANSAASAGSTDMPITMVSECCNDHVGDIIVNFLKSHKVEVSSIDRYTDGATAVSLIFDNDGMCHRANYINYPNDRFDVVWPRIDENDIVIFGSLYSIDGSLRDRVFEMISYAAERKAILIYLPGFQHGINCRITKVMPAILENFEIANIVIANDKDLEDIFPGEGAEKAYKNHIEFYCSNFLHIDKEYNVTVYSHGSKTTYANNCTAPIVNALGWQAGFATGVMYALFLNNINLKQLIVPADDERWGQVLQQACDFAAASAVSKDNCISEEFASVKAKMLNEAMVAFNQQP